jgi:FlaA1/EpsC-like NDP-sugar epimerase
MNPMIRKAALIFIDLIIIWASVCMTYFLRFGWAISEEQVQQMLQYSSISSIVVVGTMMSFHLYNRVWQYASIKELLSIVKAVFIGVIVSFAIMYFVSPIQRVPYSVLIRVFETTILLVGGSRFAWRVWIDSKKSKEKNGMRNALIIGAGDCGVLVVKELLANPNAKILPVAFIDDNPFKRRNRIMGLPVVDDREGIISVVNKFKIQEIIIAIPSASKNEIAAIVSICKKTSAKLKIVPDIRAFIDGRVGLGAIREVNVEDLLGREQVQTDLDSIVSYVTGRTVLITGAGGSIGSELSRQIASFAPEKLMLLGHGENSIYTIGMELQARYPKLTIHSIIADVQDQKRIDKVFETYKPHCVFHAAAHKHVPLMEDNPTEAVKNNVLGTRNVAEAAEKYMVDRFVMISTDKAVNPTSVMGTTKRIAEMFVQAIGKSSRTKFVVVRFGNVLGSRGSVIPRFKEQIQQGGPVTVTHPDMIRYFMTIPEAVQLVIQAGSMAKGGEIYTLDMGEPVRIVQLAEDLIRLSGFEPYKDIEITFTGIRPGEKLYEELYLDEELMAKTSHPRIYKGSPIDVDNDEAVTIEIEKLEGIIEGEPEQIRSLLHSVVPTYMQVS